MTKRGRGTYWSTVYSDRKGRSAFQVYSISRFRRSILRLKQSLPCRTTKTGQHFHGHTREEKGTSAEPKSWKGDVVPASAWPQQVFGQDLFGRATYGFLRLRLIKEERCNCSFFHNRNCQKCPDFESRAALCGLNNARSKCIGDPSFTD